MLSGCNFMNSHIRLITVLIICVITYNQLLQINSLYQKKRMEYSHSRNELILSSVYEFNLLNHNLGKNDIVSFNSKSQKLIYFIDGEKHVFQLNSGDDIRKIEDRQTYDLRNPETWTLANLRRYLQEKQDSLQLEFQDLRMFMCDSSGRVKESWPEQTDPMPEEMPFGEPMGFLSGDKLFADYAYPWKEFVQAASYEIFQTILLSVLLVICVITLLQTIRNEKRKGKYRESFMHHIVHDLKRPISNQLKVCYLLRETSPEESIRLLEKSQEELEKMLYSVDRLLLQSTDAHGLKLMIQEIDLREMLETLTAKTPEDAEKTCRIQLEFQPEDPTIFGDYDLLSAVFQNLVDNALKYSGKSVDIQIRCSESDKQQLEITFQDNGFGIPPDNLKHVFERFYRGDSPETKKSKGHGLGLYYAKTILLAHRGKIHIDSEQGKGSTVRILLPRKANIKRKYKLKTHERT